MRLTDVGPQRREGGELQISHRLEKTMRLTDTRCHSHACPNTLPRNRDCDTGPQRREGVELSYPTSISES